MGAEHEAKIVTLDKDARKMSLSIKQMAEDPWTTIETKFSEGSKHVGTVKNITPYGVFVELETGIGGMIHISDLSWMKRLNHPGEFTKVGEQIDTIIMSIDKDNRKLQLGHKQLEEDPWNSLEDTFGVGTTHEGTVTKKDDRGALVQLAYGLEGYAPARHLFKEDGKQVAAEETAQFVVIEFDRNEKRILLSHTRIWEQVIAEEKEVAKKEAIAENEQTKKAVKNIQSKVEKSTLGDLGSLADIRAKLEGGEAAAAASTPDEEK
jgi:small subunit ribosomal protein S1